MSDQAGPLKKTDGGDNAQGDGEEDDEIMVSSGCSEAGRPFVNIVLRVSGETLAAQMDAQAARAVAGDMIGAAASADADAMLLAFFRRHGFPDGAWSAMVAGWREFSQTEKGAGSGKGTGSGDAG